MALFRRRTSKQGRGRQGGTHSDDRELARSSVGTHRSNSPEASEDRSVNLVLVLPGEQSAQSELTLQGSIQVGLLVKALSEDRIDGLYACEQASCMSTAEKIREDRSGLEIQPFPHDPEQIPEWLSEVRASYAGATVLLVAEESALHWILGALEGGSNSEISIPSLSPASLSRTTIRPDMSYTLRVNNTDHLDGVTNLDRFRFT